jgi:hypothetical protein
LKLINEVQFKAGEFTIYLSCDGLDRVGAGKLAFVLQFWSLFGRMPKQHDIVSGAILPADLN